ncbi:hypothetical protein [Rhizobium leguminosarum]|uniref:hypothetical protein n=1 Tax=Rhizobium leguminosarum TaxID=384 RepID=UPI000380EE88|nr:hypothetical protein [Rhizobium leguminosarum]
MVQNPFVRPKFADDIPVPPIGAPEINPFIESVFEGLWLPDEKMTLDVYEDQLKDAILPILLC